MTPTPTPTPTAAAYKPATPEGPAENVPVPEMPAAAKKETDAGREAFIKYYFDLMNYTFAAMDPTLMSQYTSPECKYCQNLLGSVQLQASKDVYVVGGELTLNGVELVPGKDPQGVYSAQVNWDKADYRAYFKSGGPAAEQLKGGANRVWTISTYFVNGKWAVNNFDGPYE
ncbi:DUF6318 family protein [Haematomicrobium sanguinis]|uniref:DUF6318 family protein n=1 Tax=Haematomicrobium sanguinis TaxID=479106 RepID=UPI00069064CD|nr:DUF6318 family protein [Haematomicrobium sanguinis]